MRFYRTDDRDYKTIDRDGFEPGAYWKTGLDEARNLFNYFLTKEQSRNHAATFSDRKSTKQNDCMARMYEVTPIKDFKTGKVKKNIPMNYANLSTTIKFYGRAGWKVCPFFSSSLSSKDLGVAAAANTYYFDLDLEIYVPNGSKLDRFTGENLPEGVKVGFVLDNSEIDKANTLAFVHGRKAIKECEVSFFTPVPGDIIHHMKTLTKAPAIPSVKGTKV